MTENDHRAKAKARITEALKANIAILQDGPTYVLGNLDAAAEAILVLFGYPERRRDNATTSERH